jgi:hypothetical protein
MSVACAAKRTKRQCEQYDDCDKHNIDSICSTVFVSCANQKKNDTMNNPHPSPPLQSVGACFCWFTQPTPPQVIRVGRRGWFTIDGGGGGAKVVRTPFLELVERSGVQYTTAVRLEPSERSGAQRCEPIFG